MTCPISALEKSVSKRQVHRQLPPSPRGHRFLGFLPGKRDWVRSFTDALSDVWPIASMSADQHALWDIRTTSPKYWWSTLRATPSPTCCGCCWVTVWPPARASYCCHHAAPRRGRCEGNGASTCVRSRQHRAKPQKIRLVSCICCGMTKNLKLGARHSKL